MYRITIYESPVCIAHQLHLPYESKCRYLHGHNYQVEVVLESPTLNSNGMVVDFVTVKQVIKQFDHAVLGKIFDIGSREVFFDHQHPGVEPSTAENFAQYLLGAIQAAVPRPVRVVSVKVFETASSEAVVS